MAVRIARTLSCVAVLFVLLLLLSLSASAQTVTTNGTNGDWTNPGVWTGGTVPNGSTFNVEILSTPNTVSITLANENITVNTLSLASVPGILNPSLTIENGSNLTVDSTVDNSGSIIVEGGSLNVASTFTNAGQLFVSDSGVVNVGSLTNNGSINIGAGGTLNITGGGLGVTVLTHSLDLGGNFNVINGSNVTSALANLTTIEAEGLLLGNGQTTNDSPIGGTLTIDFDAVLGVVGNGTTLNVAGNLSNSFILDIVGGVVNVSGNLTNGPGQIEFFNPGGQLNIGGNLTNTADGAIGFQDDGEQINVNSLTNDGFLLIGGRDTLNFTGGGSGVTDIPAGSIIELEGNLTVTSGTLITSGLAHLTSIEGDLELDNGQTINDAPLGGTLTIANTGQLTFQAGALDVIGNLDNLGAIQVNAAGQPGHLLQIQQAFANGGLVEVKPGNLLAVGTGALNSAFGYQQFANGTFNELIQNASTLGLIDVNGSVSLSGTLDVTLAKGFAPPVGTSFDIMNFTAGDLTGTWSSIGNDVFNNGTEMWVVVYVNSLGEIRLRAEKFPTPEPVSLLLLSTGLLAIGILTRSGAMRRSSLDQGNR